MSMPICLHKGSRVNVHLKSHPSVTSEHMLGLSRVKGQGSAYRVALTGPRSGLKFGEAYDTPRGGQVCNAAPL